MLLRTGDIFGLVGPGGLRASWRAGDLACVLTQLFLSWTWVVDLSSSSSSPFLSFSCLTPSPRVKPSLVSFFNCVLHDLCCTCGGLWKVEGKGGRRRKTKKGVGVVV